MMLLSKLKNRDMLKQYLEEEDMFLNLNQKIEIYKNLEKE